MTSIFVAKLDFGVSNQELRQLFENYGTVLKATVATDRETGKPRGFAFVEMADRQEASNAISALDGHVINGRALAVKEAEQRTDSRPSPRPFTPRDNSAPARSNDAPAPRSESRSDDDTPAASFILPKSEPRKKVNVKERKIEDDNRNKKPKMDAYKKSGKNPRFFDDDDDELDDELLNYKKPDEDFFDDDEDEDDF
ncbi:MAG: RNA-binding protein [Crocinitomicaceae bacterium]|jgi:RNA recognition motif-containing protein|nr:RNA-binding protein [Crocinitomicaceae bacterium]MDP4723490.1 RNA-binding protein [Crocinitomicaceae bacterium]MDP4738608.1 RNA-binding protein [Crocinitomicaceae bacterium]MDP4798621.1 RNA-binding protein [Crocinitomicaceae bacterium]MDP4805662.1 RNA-binding protein [Crocinitomicaceae bacterium]